jgi:hypothetical protein
MGRTFFHTANYPLLGDNCKRPEQIIKNANCVLLEMLEIRNVLTSSDGTKYTFEIEPQAKGSKGNSLPRPNPLPGGEGTNGAQRAAQTRDASITLRSELKQPENFGIPTDDATIESKLGGKAVKFYDARKIYKAANIDWNTHNVFENKQSNTAEDEKKKHENADKGKKRSWLADFLGADNSNDKKDVVKMTGLKVKLGGEKKDKS